MTVVDLCSFDGCTNPVEAAGLCSAHRKQKTRGQPLRPLKPVDLTPWQLLEKASGEYEDADIKDDAAYERARERLAYAARVYGRQRRQRVNDSSHPSVEAPKMGASFTATLRILAAKARCDERTVQRVLDGLPVRRKTGRRVLKVLREAGLKPSGPTDS